MITVACERFDGPVDLLLALVRRNQYPLDRLPIAEITRQYSAYIKNAREADVELGSEFIETASWLVLLKSRSMLPQASEADAQAEDAPERELERALLDHETLRAAADVLRVRMEAAGLGSGGPERGLQAPPAGSSASAAGPPTVQDVVEAARRASAVAQAHGRTVAALAAPETMTVEEALQCLAGRLSTLEAASGVSTAKWFEEMPTHEARIALFLALLELARLGTILLAQPQPFGAILLKKLPS